VRARLVRDDVPVCFEATFPSARASTDRVFHARSTR
jgi:hypothetical protein